jgi:hypothetical protein
MSGERYIKAIIYLAATVFTVVLFVHHEAIQSQWLQYLSTVVVCVLYAVMLFDIWLWKLPWLHSWFVKRPVVDGTWQVELRSNWIDPATGAGIAPVEGYAVIRQTFSTLSLRLLTAESTSELVGTEIACSADGLYCISGVYRNEPRFQVREKSPIHYGAVWLRVIEEPAEKKLVGHYWTDRKTGGELESSGRITKKIMTFESGRAQFVAGRP